MVFFGIHLPKRGIPLKRFLQNLAWLRESTGPHRHTKFHRSGFKKCGPTAAKIGKNRNFWYKFARGKILGPTEKLSIGAQLQTFLHAMTP